MDSIPPIGLDQGWDLLVAEVIPGDGGGFPEEGQGEVGGDQLQALVEEVGAPQIQVVGHALAAEAVGVIPNPVVLVAPHGDVDGEEAALIQTLVFAALDVEDFLEAAEAAAQDAAEDLQGVPLGQEGIVF